MIRALSLILVVASAAACKSDCEQVCETSKDCGFVDQRFANVDCGDACSVAEDFAVGCEAEFDAYYGCLADSIDGCTAKDPCLAQSAAFNDCMGD